jgi:uncharacterized phage-associated protein
MMTSAIDVAAALRLGGITDDWKVQKLVYYCQAWSLVWDDEPLFPEEIQAWRDGPVCPAVRNASYGAGDPSVLSQRQVDTVSAVLTLYGRKPPSWLIELTHREKPWIDARGDVPRDARTSTEIPKAALKSYYAGYKVDHKAFSRDFEETLELLVSTPEGLPPLQQDTFVDAEPFLQWLETGGGDPWVTSSSHG